MKLREALKIIRYQTGTVDDITGQNINQYPDNQTIVFFLNLLLDEYANATKAIEDVYSFPLNTQVPYTPMPPLALRSQTFRFMFVVLDNRLFPMDISDINNISAYFPVRQIQGIPSWIMPWGTTEKRMYVYPMLSTKYSQATLAMPINSTDTTIPVVSTTGFLSNDGRITIGTEKIQYESIDATNFYGCIRGNEQTTAQSHASPEIIYENNVFIWYNRIHTPVSCINNNLTEAELNQELEVPSEHIINVLKSCSYELLIKVDPNRAKVYQMDFKQWLLDAKKDIRAGRARIHKSNAIRDSYWFERSIPLTNSIY